jgi:hypothetical protein
VGITQRNEGTETLKETDLRFSVPPCNPYSVPSVVSVICAALLAWAAPAFAQFDLTGKWASRSSQDAQERGSGPDLVDYLGLPLNDEGRARALSYNYSLLSLPDGQCGYLTPYYIVLGPFALHIWNDFDPVTGRLVAWKIGAWVDRDATTIWMDGRPHPSPNAPRSYGGFTTGKWEGDTLVTTTTHMKASMIRRNGAPVSDQATMTMYFFRHGDLLTIRAVMDDPVYFSEPLIRSRVWALDRSGAINLGNGVASPCEPIAELPVADTTGVVPHYLPGQNPFVNELTERHNIPVEAVLGGAETMYPEYRKRLKGYVPPAACKRYCGCGGLGVPCIEDGTGVPK